MNPSTLLSLNSRDAKNSIAVGLIVTVLGVLLQIFEAPDFSFATFDWQFAIKLLATAIVGYLVKNLMTASNGKIFGKI